MKKVKKDSIFTALLLVIAALLFLLRVTGMGAHIAISVAGLAIIVISAVFKKGNGEKAVYKLLKFVLYAVAFVSGVLCMKFHGVAPIAIAHKISAVLFTALIVLTLIKNLFFKKA